MALLQNNRITVSFPEETKAKLEAEALKRGWNLSQLVREIVKEYFHNQEVK